MTRLGKTKLQEVLAPFSEVPSFEEDPGFYQDWGHENEKFAIRTGIKGECAGAPVQEKAPVMSEAKERAAQAEAFFAHKEYANAQIEAYEAMGKAARVPLYANLVDPFTSEQALWEFENIFVRTGKLDPKWLNISDRAEEIKSAEPNETHARSAIDLARQMIELASGLLAELLQKK